MAGNSFTCDSLGNSRKLNLGSRMDLTAQTSEILEVNPDVVYTTGSNDIVAETSWKEILGNDSHEKRPLERSKVLKLCCNDGLDIEDSDTSKASRSGLRKKFVGWIENPLNMALILWASAVAVSSVILLAAMTGMLNGVLTKSQRGAWVEVSGQILTALFTLMCLYHHPTRIHHLVLLWRWNPSCIFVLRETYSKNGTCKPHERFHMTVLVILFHVNYFSQYAVSGLYVGYKRWERPHVVLGLCIFIAVSSGIISSAYANKSPLGREYGHERDEEAQNVKRYSFASKNQETIIEHAPKWRGGLLHVCDDFVVSFCALFCSCCVFGWNMERLGFGNMYVHIARFLLFCIAPAMIFTSAAINIDDETVKHALAWTGLVLSFLGSLYGGFWRIKMRERYNLPANNWFCGKPGIVDCAQWTCFCCCCSLAQEVRTGSYYEILEDESCNENCETSSTLSTEHNEEWALQKNDHPILFCAGPSNHIKDLIVKPLVPLP